MVSETHLQTILSEEDVEAAELLDELRSSRAMVEGIVPGAKARFGPNYAHKVLTDPAAVMVQRHQKEDTVESHAVKQGDSTPSILDMVYNNVVGYYGSNQPAQPASSLFSAGSMKKRGATSVTEIKENWSNTEQLDGRYSKRQRISDAIARSKDNLKECKLNLSIESKKRLVACVHLLKLANKQLTNKVVALQELVEEEQKQQEQQLDHSSDSITAPHKAESDAMGTTSKPKGHNEDEEDDEFFDAPEFVDERSTEIKMEVVGTIKKVYSVISRFTGNSLPEPERSQVRRSLLELPSNWTAMAESASRTTSNGSTLEKYNQTDMGANGYLTANYKVLLLAKESLDMVRNVMGVVDSTLERTEEKVKQRLEFKEMIREKLIQRTQETEEKKEF